jgi:hypothetical protein
MSTQTLSFVQHTAFPLLTAIPGKRPLAIAASVCAPGVACRARPIRRATAARARHDSVQSCRPAIQVSLCWTGLNLFLVCDQLILALVQQLCLETRWFYSEWIAFSDLFVLRLLDAHPGRQPTLHVDPPPHFPRCTRGEQQSDQFSQPNGSYAEGRAEQKACGRQ